MSIRLLFSFDCEDYITPEAADAERWWAETMSRHGVRACLCVVGELARALRGRGRRDVIRAMARHEISYHSDFHSVHPTHAELLEGMGWEEGVAAVMAREAAGIRDLEDVFGERPVSFCKAGYSWGPAVPEAMRRMGVPVLSDSPFEWSRGQPMWYGNMLGLEYHCSFDSYFDTPGARRLARMKADFRRRLAEFRGGTLVMYTHPCRLVTSEFWDGVNFSAGRNMPREHWQPAALRPATEIEQLQRDFDAFIGWVVRRRDVQVTHYRELYATHRPPADAWIGRAELGRALRALTDPPQPVRTQREWLSPAEIVGLAARALAVYSETGRLPVSTPVRRPLGPTAPQPPPPPAGVVSLPALLAAAREVDAAITATGALPAQVPMAGNPVGPNVFLQTAARAFGDLASGLRPAALPAGAAAETTQLATRPDFATLHFRGTWSIFAPDFEAPNVAEMARWQAWSGKPARPVRA